MAALAARTAAVAAVGSACRSQCSQSPWGKHCTLNLRRRRRRRRPPSNGTSRCIRPAAAALPLSRLQSRALMRSPPPRPPRERPLVLYHAGGWGEARLVEYFGRSGMPKSSMTSAQCTVEACVLDALERPEALDARPPSQTP
eukprot:1067023-Prymnesium_polylepis.1